MMRDGAPTLVEVVQSYNDSHPKLIETALIRTISMMTILTDAHGRPFEKPLPPKDCPYVGPVTIEVKIAYLRAMARYNDAVANCANQAFAEGFAESLKRG